MKIKSLFIIAVIGILFVNGCSKDTVDPFSFEEPIPEIRYGNSDDSSLELLEKRVGFYSGTKDNLRRVEYACRSVDSYCIFPQTESRAAELEALAKQANSNVIQTATYFLIHRDRNFITNEDFVSDRYFVEYSGQEACFAVVCPLISVKFKSADSKQKIINKYKGILTESSTSPQYPGENLYHFDCSLKTSQQVMELADELYRLNDVVWATCDQYYPIHISD